MVLGQPIRHDYDRSGMADVTYIEPSILEHMVEISGRNAPMRLLPNLGGPDGVGTRFGACRAGVLEAIRCAGDRVNVDAIERARTAWRSNTEMRVWHQMPKIEIRTRGGGGKDRLTARVSVVIRLPIPWADLEAGFTTSRMQTSPRPRRGRQACGQILVEGVLLGVGRAGAGGGSGTPELR